MALINKRNKRGIIIVTSSTVIGFLGNYLSYSVKVPTHKGAKWNFISPKGHELYFSLAVGFIAGLIIDKVVNGIENTVKTKEEKLLDDLVIKEKQKISEGLIINKNPTGVIWA